MEKSYVGETGYIIEYRFGMLVRLEYTQIVSETATQFKDAKGRRWMKSTRCEVGGYARIEFGPEANARYEQAYKATEQKRLAKKARKWFEGLSDEQVISIYKQNRKDNE